MNQVVKLYEQCLIACANYPDYWICMEASGSMDLAANALTRANLVFVKRQPEIHLFATRFREQNGDVPGARVAYQLVHSEVSPGFLEAIIKHANMERHMGKLQDAFALYEHGKGTVSIATYVVCPICSFFVLEPLVEKFIVPNSDSSNFASATDKEELSSIFIEEHVRDKKAHADEFLALEKAKMAKSYSSDPSATQAAYPNAQNQWVAAGYGTYYAG
ncbi:hypothetical protein ACFE04_027961 [Oxalis oulophora]